MSGTRWVLVDDKDPGISWSGGPWFESSEGFDFGNWGLPWRGSQHGTNASASLSYTFSGTRVRVLGTSASRMINGVADPSWTCTVGDAEVLPSPPWTAPINNWPLCESPTYTAGQHTLTLSSTTTGGTTLWVDQIRYLPLAESASTFTGATVVVEHSDSDIKYVSGSWQDLTTSAKLTLQAGSVMTAKFTGTKLTWVAWTPSGYPTGLSQATYSIDNGVATTFNITGLPAGFASMYNQHLFESPDLPPGDHTLTVTYNGPSAPLVLDHLLIANGNIILPPGSGTGTEGSPGSSPGSGSTVEKKGPPTAIIGGAVGGGVGLILIGVLVFILLRRRSKRHGTGNRISVKGSGMFPAPIAQVTPFTYNGASYASSQANLTIHQQPSAGWGSASAMSHGTTPYPGVSPFDSPSAPFSLTARRDQKSRNGPGGQLTRPDIPLQEFGYPPTPRSEASSSSRAGLLDRETSSSHARSESSKSGSGPTSIQAEVVQHQDSGLRLAPLRRQPEPPATNQLLDVPPSYTPG